MKARIAEKGGQVESSRHEHTDRPAGGQACAEPVPAERLVNVSKLVAAYLMEEIARLGDPAATTGRVILAHLGIGASMAAARHGKSIDTSMGFTPTAGLVMSTRSGDLDPGLAPYLSRTNHDNTHVRGYKEEGTITTPFDMTVLNDLDRFHLAMDTIDRLPQTGDKGIYLKQQLKDKLIKHEQYIDKVGEDMPEIRNWKWSGPK